MVNADTPRLPPSLLGRVPPHPAGSVTTYGRLAAAVGSPNAARAAGRAMACNPYAPEVPCHRVVASDGRLTGYSGDGGVERKAAMLAAEGVPIENGRWSCTRPPWSSFRDRCQIRGTARPRSVLH